MKVTTEILEEMIHMRNNGVPLKKVAAHFNINPATASIRLKGKYVKCRVSSKPKQIKKIEPGIVYKKLKDDVLFDFKKFTGI